MIHVGQAREDGNHWEILLNLLTGLSIASSPDLAVNCPPLPQAHFPLWIEFALLSVPTA